MYDSLINKQVVVAFCCLNHSVVCAQPLRCQCRLICANLWSLCPKDDANIGAAKDRSRDLSILCSLSVEIRLSAECCRIDVYQESDEDIHVDKVQCLNLELHRAQHVSSQTHVTRWIRSYPSREPYRVELRQMSRLTFGLDLPHSFSPCRSSILFVTSLT